MMMFALAGGTTTPRQNIRPPSASRPATWLPAADHAVPVPPGRQVFYERNDFQMVQIRPGFKRGEVHGEQMTIALLDHSSDSLSDSLPVRVDGKAQEHAVFQLEGEVGIQVSAKRGVLGPGSVMVVPPQSAFTITSVTGSNKVLSFDVAPIVAPESAQVARSSSWPSAQFVTELETVPWVSGGGIQFKAVVGKTLTVILTKVPATAMKGLDVPGHHHNLETLFCVLQGHATARVGDRVRSVGPGSVMVIPSGVEHLSLESANNEDILLVEFQPIARHDLRELMN